MTPKPDHFPPTEPAPRSNALSLREAAMLQTGVLRAGGGEDAADDSLDLKALLRIVLKHKWMLLSVALLCLAAAVVKTLLSTPMYQSVTTLQIDRSTARIVAFNKDVDAAAEAAYGDDMMMLQTQYELLRSRSLAERVVDEMGMDPSRSQGLQPGMLGDAASLRMDSTALAASSAQKSASREVDRSYGAMLGNLKDRVIQGYEKLGTPSITDQQVIGRDAVVRAFMRSVVIEPVRNSRLVRIKVEGADPARAARVANTLAQVFIAVSMERRMESSNYARDFLEGQIKSMKAKLEESERTLNTYAKTNSLLTLDEKTNVINQTFTDYSSALSKLEQERLKVEAQYTEMARNPDNSVQVLDNKTVQAFKEQKAKLEAEYLVSLGVYKPDFPKMVQTRAQIAELDLRIKAEVASVLASIKSQFDAAKRQEDQVRARVLDTRKEVLVSQDRGVDLSMLKRELDTNRQIYDNLLQRLKEVGVSSSVTTNNISVVDMARVPLFPFKPDLMTNAAIGLAVGLMLGLGFVFVREHLDDSVKHADEVEAQFGVPLLGIIPQVRKSKKDTAATALLAVDDPRGAFAESYRSMRTALQFSTSDGAPRRLMVTSSVAKEGKSTTALALAINFAQLGRRVLLVDADMRNPSLHKSLDLSNDRGLSNYLSGEGSRESLIRGCSVPNLQVLTAGPMPPSPVDLLMGPKLLRLLDKAEEMGFDQVLIDSPPILGIADALVLGNQVQNILFVVKAGDTRRSSIKDAMRRLRTAGLMPLGVALTRASSQHNSYYGYEGYYGYGYGKGKEVDDAAAAAAAAAATAKASATARLDRAAA